MSDTGRLGRAANDTLTERPGQRWRSVFPLPFPPRDLVAAAASPEVPDPLKLLAYIDAVVASLNYGFGCAASRRRPESAEGTSSVQRSALQRVIAAAVGFCERLIIGARPGAPPEAAVDALEEGLGVMVPLKASLVDNISPAAAVDPLPHLPEATRAVVCDPEALFPDRPAGLDKFKDFTAGPRVEYLSLVADQLRCGELGLRLAVQGGGTVFAVPKKERQREVWHGRRVSQAALRPPAPPHLACPSTFRWLRVDPRVGDGRMRMSKRDGKCLFDQLRLPPEIQGFMGRPPVLVSELQASGFSDSWILSLLPPSEAVVVDRGRPLDPSLKVWPVNLCWGMGFAWSSYIAQATMLSVARSAGLSDPLVLAPDAPLPPLPTLCYTLATDDLVVLSIEGPGATLGAVAGFDKALADHGVVKQGTKDVNDELSGTSLGIDLVDGTHWWGESTKMWKVLQVTLGLVAGAHISPRGLAAHMGLVQWLDLVERLKLSFYGEVYLFYADPTDTRRRALPAAALRELLVGAVLGCFWSIDMTRAFAPFVGFTDASTGYGLGACVSEAPEAVIVAAARHHGLHDVYVTMDMVVPPKAAFPDHLGRRYALPLHESSFLTVIKIRVDDDVHINVLEARALLAFVKWVARAPSRHGHRVVVGIDSKVVHGAVTKGRAQTWAIRSVLRQIGSLCMACGIVLFVFFVPTHWDPADRSSRGLPDLAGAERCRRRLDAALRRHRDQFRAGDRARRGGSSLGSSSRASSASL
jgi:hypothetical protein